jgi:hypothetical protein
MRLCSFSGPNGPLPGLVVGDEIVPLSAPSTIDIIAGADAVPVGDPIPLGDATLEAPVVPGAAIAIFEAVKGIKAQALPKLVAAGPVDFIHRLLLQVGEAALQILDLGNGHGRTGREPKILQQTSTKKLKTQAGLLLAGSAVVIGSRASSLGWQASEATQQNQPWQDGSPRRSVKKPLT